MPISLIAATFIESLPVCQFVFKVKPWHSLCCCNSLYWAELQSFYFELCNSQHAMYEITNLYTGRMNTKFSNSAPYRVFIKKLSTNMSSTQSKEGSRYIVELFGEDTLMNRNNSGVVPELDKLLVFMSNLHWFGKRMSCFYLRALLLCSCLDLSWIPLLIWQCHTSSEMQPFYKVYCNCRTINSPLAIRTLRRKFTVCVPEILKAPRHVVSFPNGRHYTVEFKNHFVFIQNDYTERFLH